MSALKSISLELNLNTRSKQTVRDGEGTIVWLVVNYEILFWNITIFRSNGFVFIELLKYNSF